MLLATVVTDLIKLAMVVRAAPAPLATNAMSSASASLIARSCPVKTSQTEPAREAKEALAPLAIIAMSSASVSLATATSLTQHAKAEREALAPVDTTATSSASVLPALL